MGAILEPKLTSQDCKQAQTLLTQLQTCCTFVMYDQVIMPKSSTYNDPKEIAYDIHEYVRNN